MPSSTGGWTARMPAMIRCLLRKLASSSVTPRGMLARKPDVVVGSAVLVVTFPSSAAAAMY
jgi:hypothetical protein